MTPLTRPLLMKIVSAFLFCPTLSYAQQNYFNVPSSELTPKNKAFFQQQFNFFQNGSEYFTTFCYGLGKEAEIGFNILAVTVERSALVFHDYHAPYKPLYTLNAQKRFYLRKFDVALGGHFGFNRKGKTAAYVYANHINKIPRWKTKILTGIYYSDYGYHGGKTRNFTTYPAIAGVGFQIGAETNLYKEKWLFQTDYISGYHIAGTLAAGGAYVANKVHVISFGYLLPLRDVPALSGFVLEYTFAPLSAENNAK